jgi:hypothetical protein
LLISLLPNLHVDDGSANDKCGKRSSYNIFRSLLHRFLSLFGFLTFCASLVDRFDVIVGELDISNVEVTFEAVLLG